MASCSDCITRPLDVVASLYRSSSSKKAGEWGVQAAFAAALADPALLAKVHLGRSCLILNFENVLKGEAHCAPAHID